MNEQVVSEIVLKIAESYYRVNNQNSRLAWKLADMETKQKYINEAAKDLNTYHMERKTNEAQKQ